MSVDSNDVLQALENADEQETREIKQALGIGHTRRDVLKGAAAVGGGASIGAGAASEMTGEAKADPSTADSDGNVGLPGDRVDVFAEGIDGNSVDTGDLGVKGGQVYASLDGLVVPVAEGLGVKDAIDPANTNTPFADAVSLVKNNGVSGSGTILLPPEFTTDASSTKVDVSNIAVIGHGIQNTSLVFSDLSSSGLECGAKTYLDGFTIDGDDQVNRTSGSAIEVQSSSALFNIGRLNFFNWGSSDPVINLNGPGYSCHWNILRGASYDGTFLHVNNGGPGLEIGHLYIGSDDYSDEIYIERQQVHLRIGSVNIGSSGGRALRNVDDRVGYCEIGEINHESGVDLVTNAAGPEVVELYTDGRTQIGSILFRDGIADQIVRLTGTSSVPHENTHIGSLEQSGSTVNTSALVLDGNSEINSPVVYGGEVGDVTNNQGSASSDPIVTLGDVTKKFSVGTGYDGGTNDSQL